ncbi:unnamed protein product [Prunus armeniaca]
MDDNSFVGVVVAASGNLCGSYSILGTGSNTWIIDTDPSDHMTYYAKFFDELSSTTRDSYITSVNGLPSPITRESTISLTPTLSFSCALLVPNIHCNLLSVGRLLDTLNTSAVFYPTHCSFQETIGHGKRMGVGLYYLTLPSAPIRDRVVHTMQSCNVKDKQQIWLWHRRLGHPSFGYLKRLFPSLFLSCDKSSFNCETCILVKSHRTVFPLSDSKAAKPFNLVHSDVWGPARVTSNGFRWFVTFIDDCTRLTWVYLMKNKHDVASILSEFCAIVFTQFHVRVKVFRTDNGAEYVNNPLTHFFRDQGIIHPTTTPFTPQQNGVFEGKNRQLLEVACSLLLDMSVPHHLWGHGVLAAAYLTNRTSSRVLDFKTPLDVLCAHTSLVSVSKLPPNVFGCVAYVHVYSHQQSKLDPCDLRCVFIDYSTTQKGYKCYHPHTQKVHVILDVTFHEDVLYYVSPSSPNQGERGSKLGSLGLQDLERRDVGEDDTNDDLGEKMTCRRVDSAWLHRSETEEDTFCPETTGRPNGRDWSRDLMPDDNTLCLETTGFPEDSNRSRDTDLDVDTLWLETTSLPDERDQSPGSIDAIPCDSCEDEFDTILPYALWTNAINVEMDALNKNKTWDLVPLPQGKKAVGCRWVFTLKYKADGSIDRYKARLVAKEYTQTYEVDYLETFAPMTKLNIVRVLLSLAANHNWPLLQFDVKNAFLHGDLQEEIYMDLPPGIPVTSKKGVRHKGQFTALIIYVDDMIVTGDDQEEIQSPQMYLASEFEMKSLGLATNMRSTSGYFTFVGGNLVTWRSKKQNVVSRSSAEAKYRGMDHGECELL